MLTSLSPRNALLLLLVVSIATIAGAWIFEAAGYLPCELCLMQRWAYYAAIPLTAVLLVAAPLQRAGLYLLALLWIGSFYLYGMGAARLGRWGGIIGWPLFISLAILVGNLWGLGRGEWAAAPETARRQLKLGLGVLLGAMVLFGIASALKT